MCSWLLEDGMAIMMETSAPTKQALSDAWMMIVLHRSDIKLAPNTYRYNNELAEFPSQSSSLLSGCAMLP